VCLIVGGFAWRRRETPAGAFAFGVCGSAAVYVLSFFAVGVASDFRYAYWAVLAGIVGSVIVASGRHKPEVP
jgi:peptidoglycan/LPS O-acetylase OafA/YrhL